MPGWLVFPHHCSAAGQLDGRTGKMGGWPPNLQRCLMRAAITPWILIHITDSNPASHIQYFGQQTIDQCTCCQTSGSTMARQKLSRACCESLSFSLTWEEFPAENQQIMGYWKKVEVEMLVTCTKQRFKLQICSKDEPKCMKA